MEFVPFCEAKKLEKASVVAVDCYLPGALNLSHWRGAGPLAAVAGDTSAAIVLNAIEQKTAGLGRPFSTNNHFDLDGFVGIWALHNPGLAGKKDRLLRAMALLGDFREIPPDAQLAEKAIQLVSWINTVEKSEFYAPFAEKEEEDSACVAKYRYFLEAFSDVLHQTDRYRNDWLQEAERVWNDLKQMEAEGQARFYADIRLLVVSAPEPLHYYALFGQSAGADMVLSIYPENRYELEYKYTTWVDAYGRPSFPRISLQPLARELNELETSVQTWSAPDVTDTGPILRLGPPIHDKEIRFDHPYNRPFYSSSIEPGEIERRVVRFYRSAYENIHPKELWTWAEIRRINRNFG